MSEWTNPWRELRARDHLVFRLAPLPEGVDGVYWPRGQRAAVIVELDLRRRDRKAALAHELVHDERGGGIEFTGQPASWDAVVSREERIVEATVARKLVPRAALVDYIDRQIGIDLGVTSTEVADEFDVPEPVAERALRSLANVEGWSHV